MAASLEMPSPALSAASRPRELAAGGRALAAILAIALAARVIVALTLHYTPVTDSADFDRIAVSLATHGVFPRSLIDPFGGPSALRPPGFPLLLAALYKLVGVGVASRRWEAGLLLQAVLGTATVWLTFLIARRVAGRGVALACALVAALWPPLVESGTSLMSEPLFTALALAAILAALIHRGSPHRLRWAIATGILLGLAALARGNGVVLVVPLGFLVWTERPRLSRQALKAPGAMLVALVLMLAPWMIRNALVLHAFVPVTTEAGYAVAGTYNAYTAGGGRFPAMWAPPVLQEAQALERDRHLNEAQLGNRMTSDGLHYVRAHPAYTGRVVYWNTLRLLGLTGTRFELFSARYEPYPPWIASLSVRVSWALAALALLGLFTAAARRAPPALWGCALALYLSVVFFYGGVRYRSPIDPLLIMLGVIALDAARRRVNRRRQTRRHPLASAAA
jgi:4-amino-4-deoxy-L-arabinose transferase-like glycosyltransferase